MNLPDLHAIEKAHERIRSSIHRTPLLSSEWLGARRSARLYLKAESLQRAGAFKFRGALNALLSMRERGELGPAGVLTYSSGNHGQAVALAARILGVPCCVVVPEDINPVKRTAILAQGGEVVPRGLTSADRHHAAIEIARERGFVILPPYDHPDVIAGQGTVALEALAERPELDALLVPVGGGGLIAGIAIAARALKPSIRVIAVEPEGADDTAQSLRAGRRVEIAPPATVADGLRALSPGELTFSAIQRHVDEVWLASDEQILEAQWLLLERSKLLVEPSGAVPLAAFLARETAWGEQSVALVISGGNADIEGQLLKTRRGQEALAASREPPRPGEGDRR